MKFIVKTQLLLAFIFVSNFAMAQDLPTEYASILSKYQKDFYDITFTDFPTLPVSRPQVLKYSAQVSVNQDKYNEFITEIRDLFRRNDIESTPFNATVNSENSWRHTDRKKEFAGYRSWDPEKPGLILVLLSMASTSWLLFRNSILKVRVQIPLNSKFLVMFTEYLIA